MKTLDRKLIYILLVVIIIFSSILIYKIKTTPNYNVDLYEEVYAEYNEIINRANEDITKNDNEVDNTNIANYESNQSNENTIIAENDVDKSSLNVSDDKVVALIKIQKINLFYPIIEETTMENLKVAPTKLWGNNPNEVGNFCIIGHNYRDWNQFSKLDELKTNDIVEITDKNGKTLKYSVYDKYTISPNDLSCTSQKTNGKKEITLITCTKDSKKRLVVKCKEIA